MAWSSSRLFNSVTDRLLADWYATASPAEIAAFEARQHELRVAEASAPKITVVSGGGDRSSSYASAPYVGAGVGLAAGILLGETFKS